MYHKKRITKKRIGETKESDKKIEMSVSEENAEIKIMVPQCRSKWIRKIANIARGLIWMVVY